MFRLSQLIVCICGMQDSKNAPSYDILPVSVVRTVTMIQGHVLLLSWRETSVSDQCNLMSHVRLVGRRDKSSNRTLKHHHWPKWKGPPKKSAGGLP